MSANCLAIDSRRRSRFLAYLVLALLVLALGLPGVALAETTTLLTQPFTFESPDACTGELLIFTGRMVLVTSSGSSHDGLKLTLQGLTAKPVLPSDALYQTTFVSNQNQTEGSGGTSTTTAEDIWVINRQGEAFPMDDFYLHIRYHTTVNAQGVPTAMVDDFDTKCR
jgi:hypothetical protein